MSNLKKLITSAIFISLILVVGKALTIHTPIIKIGFSFIPIMFAAIILGPIWTSGLCVIADILGVILMPHGNFFFGFSISAFLAGLIYGYFLYNNGEELEEKAFIIRLCSAILIVTFFVDACMNTFWISILYGKAFWVIIPTRITVHIIMLPIKIISVYTLYKLLNKPLRKFMSK